MLNFQNIGNFTKEDDKLMLNVVSMYVCLCTGLPLSHKDTCVLGSSVRACALSHTLILSLSHTPNRSHSHSWGVGWLFSSASPSHLLNAGVHRGSVFCFFMLVSSHFFTVPADWTVISIQMTSMSISQAL